MKGTVLCCRIAVRGKTKGASGTQAAHTEKTQTYDKRTCTRAYLKLTAVWVLKVVVRRGLYLLELLRLLLPLGGQEPLAGLRLRRREDRGGAVGVGGVVKLVAAFVQYAKVVPGPQRQCVCFVRTARPKLRGKGERDDREEHEHDIGGGRGGGRRREDKDDDVGDSRGEKQKRAGYVPRNSKSGHQLMQNN